MLTRVLECAMEGGGTLAVRSQETISVTGKGERHPARRPQQLGKLWSRCRWVVAAAVPKEALWRRLIPPNTTTAGTRADQASRPTLARAHLGPATIDPLHVTVSHSGARL